MVLLNAAAAACCVYSAVVHTSFMHSRTSNGQTEVVRVVAAVIEKDERYLLCRRPPHKRHGGLWEFPGGKIEEGESDLAAANRELAEELGVAVRSVAPPRFSISDPGSHFVIEFMPVNIEGSPRCIEHSELRWVPLAEMPHLDLAPSDRRFVEFLLSHDD